MNKSFAVLFASIMCAAPVFAGEVSIDPAKPTREWNRVFDGLSARRNIRSEFTELRHSGFRSKPVPVKGVMRFSPEHGVSIEHTDGVDVTVTLITAKGLFRREDGRFDPVVHDVPAARAPRLLYPVFNFDRKSVAANFTAEGELRGGDAWTMTLRPRDPDVAGTVTRVELAGTGDRIGRIVIVRDERTRIEIIIRTSEFPEKFEAPEVSAYFTGWKR
jgi:hypothetical protein